MDIQEQRHGAVTVLRPQGPIVQADADQFKAAAMDVLGRSMGRFVVDASAVPYLDSPGLEALIGLTDELGASGRVLRLAGATDTVREVMDLTGLSDRFEHFQDVTTAVRSFL